jgi:hypothetical protein
MRSVLSPWVAWRLRPRSGLYARSMGTNYLISRKWALSDRFAITDGTGVPQFDVHGRFAFSRKPSLRDSAGTEVAVIIRRGWPMRYEVLAGGQLTTVRPRGFLGKRFEIDSRAGVLEARGKLLRPAVLRHSRWYAGGCGHAVADVQGAVLRRSLRRRRCPAHAGCSAGHRGHQGRPPPQCRRGGQCNCPGRQLMPPTRSWAKSRSRRHESAMDEDALIAATR